MDAKPSGLVAQTKNLGEKWIAWTPPKRQVEGSNPSGPASNSSIYLGPRISHNYKSETALEQEVNLLSQFMYTSRLRRHIGNIQLHLIPVHLTHETF